VKRVDFKKSVRYSCLPFDDSCFTMAYDMLMTGDGGWNHNRSMSYLQTGWLTRPV